MLGGAFGDPTPYGQFSVGMRNAAQMAVNEFNARNPACPLTLTVLDTQNKTARRPSPWRRRPSPTRRCSGWSRRRSPPDVAAMGPILNAASLPFVVPAAKVANDLNDGRLVDLQPGDRVDRCARRAAATYLRDNGATKVAVIDDGTIYGRQHHQDRGRGRWAAPSR